MRIDLPEIERDRASSALWDLKTTGIAEIEIHPADPSPTIDPAPPPADNPAPAPTDSATAPATEPAPAASAPAGDRVTLLAGFDDETGARAALASLRRVLGARTAVAPEPRRSTGAAAGAAGRSSTEAGGDVAGGRSTEAGAGAAGRSSTEERADLAGGRSTWAEARGDVVGAGNIGGEGWWSSSIERVDERSWTDPNETVELTVNGQTVTLAVEGAFGHGGHPTTDLAFRLLADVAPTGSVLDFGTGTGILSLAAAAGGATSVVAIDNDPDAIAVATRNRDRNSVGTGTGPIQLLAALPAHTIDRFDVIVANVLLPVHREHGPSLIRALRPGGTLIVSGVLDEQRGEVESVYAPLRSVRTLLMGDWLGLVLS